MNAIIGCGFLKKRNRWRWQHVATTREQRKREPDEREHHHHHHYHYYQATKHKKIWGPNRSRPPFQFSKCKNRKAWQHGQQFLYKKLRNENKIWNPFKIQWRSNKNQENTRKEMHGKRGKNTERWGTPCKNSTKNTEKQGNRVNKKHKMRKWKEHAEKIEASPKGERTTKKVIGNLNAQTQANPKSSLGPSTVVLGSVCMFHCGTSTLARERVRSSSAPGTVGPWSLECISKKNRALICIDSNHLDRKTGDFGGNKLRLNTQRSTRQTRISDLKITWFADFRLCQEVSSIAWLQGDKRDAKGTIWRRSSRGQEKNIYFCSARSKAVFRPP